MIVQTAELSPSQIAALEEKAGRRLLDRENTLLCGGTPKIDSETDRQNAVLQARYRLSLLDRSERRLSTEECMAALLGDTAASLPV